MDFLQYDIDKSDLEKNTWYYLTFEETVKVTKIEGNICSITGLATTAALMKLKIKHLMLVI